MNAHLSITSLLGALGVCLFCACGTISEFTRFSKDEVSTAIELARSKALSEAGLDAGSRDIVQTNYPSVAYYKMADHFAQYVFTWHITGGRKLHVFGDGDMTKLENAKVKVGS